MTGRSVIARVEGVRVCPWSGHPVLLFRELGGTRALSVRICEAEARLLDRELRGEPTRAFSAHEAIRQIVRGLTARIHALRLVGDWEHGVSGEVEVAADRRRVRARVPAGDVAALARRLRMPVLVPAEVMRDSADLRVEKLGEWRPRNLIDLVGLQVREFGEFLEGVAPEDFLE